MSQSVTVTPILILICMVISAPFLSSSAAAALPAVSIPGSCGVQLKHNNYDGENLDLLQANGFTYVRRGFMWQAIEKEKGVYDFATYDAFVADCKARGIRILGCIALQNKLYGHPKDPEGRAGYAAYAAALAEHYKDADIIWELWNEPNVRTFWGWHGKHNSEAYAAEYVALVKAAVPAMRAANPDAIIMAGAVSGLWEAPHLWMEHCFRMGILDTGINAWSVHPYSLKCPEDYVASYARMRAAMVASGADGKIPVINSERGYPIGKKEGYAGGDEALAQEYQAWHFVRQFLIDQYSGVHLTIWYEWSGKESFSIYDPKSPTQASKACRFLLTRLDGFSVAERVELASDRDFVLRLTHPEGAETLVAWTAPPVAGTADQATPHEVSIPVDAVGSLVTHDLYGAAGEVAVTDGVIRLTLSGAPQYVTLKAKP